MVKMLSLDADISSNCFTHYYLFDVENVIVICVDLGLHDLWIINRASCLGIVRYGVEITFAYAVETDCLCRRKASLTCNNCYKSPPGRV